MKKRLALIGTLFLLSLFPITGLAADGGNVDVQGKITFFEDSSTEKTVDSSEAVVKKPVGRFPSTGEIVKKPIVWVGTALVILAMFLLFLKRRRSDDEKENE